MREETSLNVPFHSYVIESARNIKLGTSEYYLYDSGCAVASTAMVFNYYGIKTDVISLNALFTPDGFDNGWSFKWGSIPIKSKNQLIASRVWTNNPNSQRNSIEDELLKGRPVIARIFVPSGNEPDTHFVVIVGFDQKGDFLINDPGKLAAKQGKDIPFNENILGASFSSVDEFVFIYPVEDYIFNTGIKIPEPILSEFYKLGGDKGRLGKPISEASILEGTDYLFQQFENGGIFNINGDLFSLFGPIWSYFKQNGGINKYGIPKLSLYEEFIGGDIHQRADFENYSLDWSIWDKPTEVNELNDDNAFFTKFYSNSNFSGNPLYTRFDEEIDFSWGNASPIPDLDLLEYSVRFSGKTSNAIPLVLNFSGDINGKYRIAIDGDTVSNDGNQKYFEFSKLLWGKKSVEIEFNKTNQPATIRFSWKPWPFGKKVYADYDENNPLLVPPVSICELDENKNEEFCNNLEIEEDKKFLILTSNHDDLIILDKKTNETIKLSDSYKYSAYQIFEPKFSNDNNRIAFISVDVGGDNSEYQTCKLHSFNIETKKLKDIDITEYYSCIYAFDWISENTIIFSKPGAKRLVTYNVEYDLVTESLDYSKDSTFDEIRNLDVSPNSEYLLFDKVKLLGFGTNSEKELARIDEALIVETEYQYPSESYYSTSCSWAHNSKFFACVESNAINIYYADGNIYRSIITQNKEYGYTDFSLLWSLDSNKIYVVISFPYPNFHNEIIEIDIHTKEQRFIDAKCTNKEFETLWPLLTIDKEFLYIFEDNIERDIFEIFKIGIDDAHCEYHIDGYIIRNSEDKNNIFYDWGFR